MPGNATNGTRNYTANGLNQYTSAAGDTLSYNPRGLLNYNGPWAYTYEINDRLTTASKNVAGAITSGAMAYDAEGRLRQTVINLPTPSTSTRNLLHDGVNLVADYDATDTMVRRYVHGPGVDEPLVVYEGAGTATKNWQYADHLGSIIGTADSTGTSTAIYTYGPFGESSLTTGIRYGYTGQRSMAALGLLYYKARFYSPSLGRFLQPDPIGYADDLNLYAYVGNNPVNFTDPSGLILADAKLLGGKLADTVVNHLENSLAAGRNETFASTVEKIIQGSPIGPEFAMAAAAIGSIKGAGKISNQLGRAGEEAVREVYDIGDKGRFAINGNNRIADGLNAALKTLSEVKNTATQSFTNQLRDYAAYAQKQGLNFDLYVRESTILSAPLKDAINSGLIRFNLIPSR